MLGQYGRVDVFSVSGGVGKTLIAIRLAQLQARQRRAPVLFVDADIGGPCIGDLLESWASWDTVDNLLHLICGRPENLPEQLAPGRLPVYRLREARPTDPAMLAPQLVGEPVRGAALLFCPSHAHSTNPRIEPAVVHALLGHESAGGWIGYVIDEVIRATQALLGDALGGVVVDHGAALGALQTVTLRRCIEPPVTGDEGRRAVIVTSPRGPDLASARDLAGRIANFGPRAALAPGQPERIVWVVNHVSPDDVHWQDSIKRRVSRSNSWLDRALRVRADPATSEWCEDEDQSASPHAALDEDLEQVRDRIFG